MKIDRALRVLPYLSAATLVLCATSINDAQRRNPLPENMLAGRVPDPNENQDVTKQILRQPALSPDGKTLAFVYDGDLWSVNSTGGEARRLTITVDNEGSPCFSPDGSQLAFRSRRYGSDDLFVMPASGGEATRLTFADAAEDPCCWLPDGKGIVFASSQRGRGQDLWIVRPEGGEPWPITDGGFGEGEGQASVSPDGKLIAYARHPADGFHRRGYTGTADSDIWLCDFDGLSTRNHRQLTTSAANDAWPRFLNNDTIVYTTFADGGIMAAKTATLAAINLKGEGVKGWDGARLDPREISLGGGKIAFSTGSFGGWKLHVSDLGAKPPQEISTPTIKLDSDKRSQDVKVYHQTQASEFKLSPDSKKLAFVAGGDVYVMPVEEGGTPRQVTDTVGRDKDIDWAPDSRQLAFAAEQGGNPSAVVVHDLLTHESREGVHPDRPRGVSRYPGSGGIETHPRYTSDGKRVVFLNAEKALICFDLETHKPLQTILGHFLEGSMSSGDLFDISPDGHWVLYSQQNANYRQALWIANLETAEKHAMPGMFGECGDARFSHDGKRIDFICDQEGNADVYTLDLAQPAVEFKEDKLDKMFVDKKDEAKPGDKPEKPAVKPAPATLIDFEGLNKRVRRVTSLEGNESSPISADDGKTFYFIASVQGQSNVWKLTLDPDKGPDLKQLTQTKSSKGDLTLSADEKSLWFNDGGTITELTVASSKITPHPFAVDQRRNVQAMRYQVFNEAARTMKNYFYDDKMHGVDWDATCFRYQAALAATPTGDEFGGLMNELLGELSSSHQGFYAADDRTDGLVESVGHLGLEFDARELSLGHFKVVTVLKGGPCDIKAIGADGKPGTEPAIKAGEFILGVNGHELGERGVLARELLSTVGRKTTLRIGADFAGKDAREVAVKPCPRGEEFDLLYQAWVDHNRAKVAELSGGRLGYVHVAGMDAPSLAEFKHQLGDSALKGEGVVIDIRFNGGGYTAVDLLEILIKKPWLSRQVRGGLPVSEDVYRSVALEKPTCLLINQGCFSNAEVMTEGYRRLGIGKIIGVDTAGGCIGTGAVRLSDGSTMRLPSTGAYTVDGENLEGIGRKPDLFVEDSPEEIDNGTDKQLETAVTTLLAQLKK